MNPHLLRALSAILVLASLHSRAIAQEDLSDLEQKAIREAVARVEPSVVQIETVGGLEKVGGVLFGTGPTTGLVVSSDGYVISSAFNFAQRPASILVRLPSGQAWPAKLIATDHARMVVLLKVQSPAKEEKFTPANPCPEKEIEVGQWAIAVGRTFEGNRINVSEGIISAKHRMHGKALQTDAKVSPTNYGGPLVDVQGRVQGVLVPLAQGNDRVSGVGWYDAGIAFAVPLAHIMNVLPRLKEGKDMHPGIMGVNLRAGNQFADPAVIAAVRANSPAYKAGFKQGDTIVQIDGREIIRQMQVHEALGPHYAGDRVKVVVTRDKERLERELELIDKLEPYSRPFLGILPLRVAKDPAKKEKEKDKAKEKAATPAPGVTVRFVYPNSPADKAGIDDGDRILSVNGKEVADRAALREAVINLQAGAKATIDLQRGDQKVQVAAVLAGVPETIPAKLPPAMAGRKPYLGAQPPVGKQPLKLAEFKNDCFIYVPVSYDPAVPHGVVVWLHEAGALKEPKQIDDLIARFKPLCDGHDLILVIPKAEDPLQWNPGKEVPFVAQIVEKVRGSYHVDDTRIVAHGYQAGGSMAYALAFQKRELVRAVAAVDAPLAGRPPEHEPVHPLAFYVTVSQAGRLKPPQVQELVKQLRAAKYPVTLKDLGKEARYLNDGELAELVRWMDTLDRI